MSTVKLNAFKTDGLDAQAYHNECVMDVFTDLAQALEADGAAAALDLLIARLEQDRRHAEWFQARLMRKRVELGLSASE